MFQDGQTFGDFEMIGCLGQTGARATFKARQLSKDRIVVLKTMQVPTAGDAEKVARFRRDAQVALALDHPDIVTSRSARRASRMRTCACSRSSRDSANSNGRIRL